MALRRVFPPTLFLFAMMASLMGARLLLSSRPASALPPAGEDFLNVAGSVTASSRLGQETINVNGTVTIVRTDPRHEGGVEVQDVEITSLELEGQSVTGVVHVSQNPARPTLGQVRSLSAGSEFPASSFFDVFVEVVVPASPRSTLTLSNQTAVHLVPGGGARIGAWPPIGVTYRADFNPCLPLVPTPPAEVCVHSLVVTLLEGAPENPTYSVASGGPSLIHPAALLSLVPPPAATATPTSTHTPIPGTTFTPMPTSIGGPANDNFSNATTIGAFPFSIDQTTVGATTETGEQTAPAACLFVLNKGSTVWFRFLATANGTVTATTLGSSFDTVLAAYSGGTLSTLFLIACEDDKAGVGVHSEVSFPVTSGTTYYLQAGGFSSDSGQLHLGASFAAGSGVAFTPSVRIQCGALGLIPDGCDDGSDGDQDDLDALSYGADFGPKDEETIAFSVAPGSTGLPGSAVAAQAACTPAQPQADEFSSVLGGTNTLVFDGDGVNGACPTVFSLGLIERPQSDDLDALVDQPPSYVDGNNDGVPERPVIFSLAPGSPSLTQIGAGPADVLYTMNGVLPIVYASAASLGLQAGDDLDALCLSDNGIGFSFTPGTDRMLFSLAAGSPTLASIGASAADVLQPGAPVTVAVHAAQLGLQNSDDLDALKCFSQSTTPTRTPAPTRTPTPRPVASGDVNKDGRTNSIDATIVLQRSAGLIGSINASADVNLDGRVTSVDATLILQFGAGLIRRLPV